MPSLPENPSSAESPNGVNEDALRAELIERADRDIALRTALAESGELHGGYHPRMEALHRENAVWLDEMLRAGWLGTDRVGQDAEQAAWLIAQHAISLPDVMRRSRELLTVAVDRGTAPGWQLAMLTDRIRVNEGDLQVYGTQFDWDDEGVLSPLPIDDADHVDARRAAVGLEPIAEATARHRGNAADEGEGPPPDHVAHRAEQQEWARRSGWMPFRCANGMSHDV